MSKLRKNEKKKIEAALEALPECDRKFIAAFGALLDVFGDGAFRFRELPEPVQRMLQEANDDTRFNVIIECLGLLLDAPILDRIKRAYRKKIQSRRNVRQVRRAGSQDSRTHLHRRMRSK